MNFHLFLEGISKIKEQPLLAEAAHQIMSPPERTAVLEKLKFHELKPRIAAVMMLIYPKNKIAHLALIVRNTYPGIHSSQIAFPGGKEEQDDPSLLHTALRETKEEIGIEPHQINVIKPFSTVYIPPSNFLVHPFLGYSKQEITFLPDSNEVVDVLELSLEDFMNEAIVEFIKMDTSYSNAILVPVFKVQGHLVWGATAMMMSELKEILKKAL